MNFMSLLGAAGLALLTSSPISAAPINLEFSQETVRGTFYGLDDAAIGAQAATRFDVIGTEDYLGISAAGLTPNRFVFVAGVLEEVEFLFFGAVTGNEGFFDLEYFNVQTTEDGLILADTFQFFRPSLSSSIDSRPSILRFTATPIVGLPIPAGAVLLLTGLAGVAALRRRKSIAA